MVYGLGFRVNGWKSRKNNKALKVETATTIVAAVLVIAVRI